MEDGPQIKTVEMHMFLQRMSELDRVNLMICDIQMKIKILSRPKHVRCLLAPEADSCPIRNRQDKV